MKIKRVLKCLTVWNLCLVMMLGSTFDALAASFTRQGNAIQVGSSVYWENDTGGTKSYVPFQINKQGENINTLSELLKLPEMVTSYGNLARHHLHRMENRIILRSPGSPDNQIRYVQ